MNSFHLLYLIRTSLFLLFAYGVAYFYIDYAGDWATYGKGLLTFNPKIYWIEIPFFVVIASLVYFPSVKNPLLRNGLPVIPGLILYALFDVFYSYFGRVATPSDFHNILNIFSFSLKLGLGLVLTYSLIPFSIFLSIYLNKTNKYTALKRSLLVRLLIFTTIVFVIVSPMMTKFQEIYFNYSVWAQEDTVRENGRFNSSVFYAKQEHSNVKTLDRYAISGSNAINIKEFLYPGNILEKRNIHVIVLESFVDPRLIKELDLDRSFIASELLAYLGIKREFSRVISPIYGGGTAESEFELLTGIKGLGKVNQIEFNVMQGGKTNSFVNILGSYGYYSHATIAPSSEFFNSKRAYISIGFDKIEYLSDLNLLNREESDSPIFDGDLLEYNLRFLKTHLNTNNKPLFNYVLGMYGHLPFERDISQRPDVVTSLHSDKRLNRIANQFYYRTKAIADYLKVLTILDPNAIIFITSDHLPSVLGEHAHYRFNNKVNIALMLNAGDFQSVEGKKLYQIPWSIWDNLTTRPSRRVIDEKMMDELYYTLLSQSLSRND